MQESQGMQELLNEYHENRLSHAFLLETNHQEKCLNHLLEFLGYINRTGDEEEDVKLERLIQNRSIPSLVIIEPDGQMIKKEQILELKDFFKTKPIFSKYNMYVILNAEALNASSANTMLKFLEEPEDNILGFFITNNRENIISTIKSRCQVILDYYDTSAFENIPKVWKSIAINYIKEYQLVKEEAVMYNKDVLLPLIHDRKELLYLFQSMNQIYSSLNSVKLLGTSLDAELQPLEFLMKKEENFFLKELQYLAKILDDLNYNVNIQMLLDRYVLESR